MSTRLEKWKVTIILPVYAKETTFLSTINNNCFELSEAMPDVNWTFIIINDGSPEIPSENNLLHNLTANINYHYYHYQNNMGKGYAVRFGLNIAPVSDFYIYTDYDFPFGIKPVVNAVNILKQGKVDIVAAIRGRSYFLLLPFSRKILTIFIRIINKYILKLRFTDTQAGLKGMNYISLPAILNSTINGFLFDLQFIKNAEDHQIRIHPLPVECATNIQLNNFKINIIFSEIKNLVTLLFRKNAKKNPLSFNCGSGRVRYCKRIWSTTFMETTDKNNPARLGKITSNINGVEH